MRQTCEPVMLSKLITLNHFEESAVQKLKNDFKEKDFDETRYMENLVIHYPLDWIIKLTENDDRLNEIYLKDEYRQLWKEKLLNLHSMVLSNELRITDRQECQVAYFEFSEEADVFLILKGMYFFHKSQLVRLERGSEFSRQEQMFLEKAVDFNSIHAIQRLNLHLYKDASEMNFIKIIEHCKLGIDVSRSYAYMMLVEAYFRYALFQLENNVENGVVELTINSAIKSCIKAEEHLEKSTYAINYASFGRGLGASNSWGVVEPLQAKSMLEDWKKQNCGVKVSHLEYN